MIKYLQKELKPKITRKEYLSLDDKSFFKEIPSKHFDCNLCPEHCSPEIYLFDDEYFINCDADVLQSPYKINKSEAMHYAFSLDKFAQEIISKNALKTILQKEDDKTFVIGQKVINGFFYKVIYLLGLTDRHGKVKNIAIQRMRAFNTSQSMLIVITPDNFINDNAEETRLNNEGFEILQLDELHKADFIIKGLKHFEIKDVDALCKKFELILTGSKEFCYLKAKITSSPQEMQLLMFLIDNQNKDIKVDDCMKHLWGVDDYLNYGKKQLYNLAGGLRRKLRANNIPNNFADNFIKIQKNNVSLGVDPKKIHK